MQINKLHIRYTVIYSAPPPTPHQQLLPFPTFSAFRCISFSLCHTDLNKPLALWLRESADSPHSPTQWTERTWILLVPESLILLFIWINRYLGCCCCASVDSLIVPPRADLTPSSPTHFHLDDMPPNLRSMGPNDFVTEEACRLTRLPSFPFSSYKENR